MLCSMTCCTHMSIYLAMEILPEDGILSRSIMDFIKERQLTWLEHIIKMDPKQNMRRLVKNALIQHPRRGGHSPSTAKISGTQTRKPLTAIGEIDCNDPNALFKGMDYDYCEISPRLARRREKATTKVGSAEEGRGRSESRAERYAKQQRIQAEQENKQQQESSGLFLVLFSFTKQEDETPKTHAHMNITYCTP